MEATVRRNMSVMDVLRTSSQTLSQPSNPFATADWLCGTLLRLSVRHMIGTGFLEGPFYAADFMKMYWILCYKLCLDDSCRNPLWDRGTALMSSSSSSSNQGSQVLGKDSKELDFGAIDMEHLSALYLSLVQFIDDPYRAQHVFRFVLNNNNMIMIC